MTEGEKAMFALGGGLGVVAILAVLFAYGLGGVGSDTEWQKTLGVKNLTEATRTCVCHPDGH